MGVAAIPFVAMAVTAAATAVSVYSSIKSGQAQKDAANNAAEQAKLAAQREYSDTEKQHRRIIATQEARYGASGLTMEGSPLLVQQESLKESKEQLRRILEGGENTAGVYEASGKEAAISGYAGGIKSLTQGAESVYKVGNSFDWW
jgi:hypothetical protein